MTQPRTSQSRPPANIFLLAADNDVNKLLPLLHNNTSTASSQDEHGYSLIHAAASYGHAALLRQLVNEFHVDIDMTDEDGETGIFQVETVDVARVMVQELGANVNIRNAEGQTAVEKIEAEGDWPPVAAYLRGVEGVTATGSIDNPAATEGAVGRAASNDVHPPPPLPPNISINVGTMDEAEQAAAGEVVDPELRRRIEDLASRDDFQSEAGQNELKDLISAAVKDHLVGGSDRDVRRRTD
ncbi:MAG: hypothetical protein M1833_007411 [Piccolia ochrophora]|nr:MAG: hypothetical protein M1833_007411 [Piccolia ochrophora]